MTDTLLPYSTPDLNQAAFLWSQEGIEFVGTSMAGKKVYFKFDVSKTESELQKVLLDYSNGKTLVEPNTFCNNQFTLRGWLHNSRDSLK